MPQPELSESHAYLRRVTLPFLLPTGVYGAMLVIWHLIPPLQFRFPLHKGRARDYVRFLAWCATEGRREYQILRSIPQWDLELAQPIALPSLYGDQWRDLYSVVMFFHGLVQSHYISGPMLARRDVRHQVALAFWRGNRHACHAPPIAFWQRKALAEKFGSMDALLSAIRIPRHDRKQTNQQLFRQFHLSDLENLGREDLSSHAGEEASQETMVAHLPRGLNRSPIRIPRFLLPSLSLMEWLNGKATEFQLSSVTRLFPTERRRIPKSEDPFGVNLYGYARGELGIGEDVRLVAAALEAQGIPFCIVNVEPGKDISQEDRSVEHWISGVPRYAINLFCLTGVEQGRLACEKGVEMFRGRYNIGLSPWELPHWPSSCQYAYGAVDEIWGISSYAARAYLNAPHPVRAMTLPVTVEPVEDVGRLHFALPEKAYLFVFAFDINSSLARKNPEGVIRAFQKAFPKEGADEVGLVIKVNVATPKVENLGFWERLEFYFYKLQSWNSAKRLAAKDPRIHLIEYSMRRPRVMALYRACDCYISLHRAEGFGRCLAEALLLGKQVITTGYSGNIDFCSEPRVGLVRYKLRPLKPGEYFWSDGQVWAEPDIDHAAELMRDIRARPRDTSASLDHFSPKAVGRLYLRRLKAIADELGLAGV